MVTTYKRLHGSMHVAPCRKLMAEIWGLPDLDVMSGITLASLLSDASMGVLAGAFDGNRQVGLFIILPTLEPGVVYGHMVGVLAEYRGGTGAGLMRFGFQQAAEAGARVMTGVFEPLESRNAALYLNKLGARAVRYMEEYYKVDCDMHRGLPMDRLSLRFPLHPPEKTMHEPPSLPASLENALTLFPKADTREKPDAPEVLVEIPFGLADVKSAKPQEARRWRFSVREILSEYLNRRGYSADRLYAGDVNGTMRSFYLLKHNQNNEVQHHEMQHQA